MTRTEIIEAICSEGRADVAAEAERVANAIADRADATEVLLEALNAGDYTDKSYETLAGQITQAANPAEAYIAVVVTDSQRAGCSVAKDWADAIVRAA